MRDQQAKAIDFTIIDKILAWLVHIFTASGLLAGFMALLAIEAKDWRSAMLWLLVCQFVDGVDGSLARRFRVKQVLPKMDGKSIDYVVDFATYAVIPAYFFYKAELVPSELNLACAFLILLVSAIYYGIDGMITDDYHFVGFPVLWNLFVFYTVFVFQLPPWLNAVMVLFFAILHFVPIKFAYPSRASLLRKLTQLFAAIALINVLLISWIYPDRSGILTLSAILAMTYFGGLAIWVTYIKPNP